MTKINVNSLKHIIIICIYLPNKLLLLLLHKRMYIEFIIVQNLIEFI